jgi:hypothetical protein
MEVAKEVAMVVDGSGRGFYEGARRIFRQLRDLEPHSVGFERE